MAASVRRERLDLLLLARGLAPTRVKAQALILAGRVRSDGRRLDKPGERIAADLPLQVDPGPRWVSRGGHKLDDALRRLGVEVDSRDAVDVGASTGGFTDVLLRAGARRVAAVDVGRGQLDWSLRNDPRVVVVEGVNARRMTPRDLPFSPTLAVVDVSFISLKLVLPAVVACLAPESEIVALVKPQFEAGRDRVPRGGVIRDPALRRLVLRETCAFVSARPWGLSGLCRSALPGAEGNVEFFLHVVPEDTGLPPEAVEDLIDRAVAETEEMP